MLREFEHVSATSLDEAATIARENGEAAALVAGGTDLLGVLKDNVHPKYPKILVDLKPVAGLAHVRADERGLKIGALATLAAVEKNPAVRERWPMLAQAARAVASPQIRNMGTVGGNVCQEPRCWYYRAPDNAFHCLRKGGHLCGALFGDNRFHSIYGASHVGVPACSEDCPAHVTIPGYLARVRAGQIDDAARMLLARNPMPAITGRVCPHYCELACNRGEVDEAVSVRSIERHLGDHVLENARRFYAAPKKESGKKVAVVGAGPAGLSAAFYLRQAGHQVVVFDRLPEPGGMLAWQIPAYRLPKEVVRKLVDAYAGMGIEFRTGVDVGGSKASLAKLRRDFDGVFLATGAWKQKTLKMEHDGLLRSGIQFLADVQKGERRVPGPRVLVIGGGNVAVDVALSALRLGAKEVTMACLEARDIMPAFPEDLEGALKEGVKLLPSWGPARVLQTDGRLQGMELVRCTSVFDAEGRFHPAFDFATQQTVEADEILLAIGQGTELEYVAKALRTERNLLVVDAETQATSADDVWAGGDAATGPATVVAALAAGRRAAVDMDAKLRGGKGVIPTTAKPPEDLYSITQGSLARSPRGGVPELPVEARDIAKEDVQTLDEKAVAYEAQRCMNCGCVAVNASDLAPALVALEAKVRTTKRTLAAGEFFAARLGSTTVLEPGEIVTEIELPAPAPGTTSSFHKFRIREAIDFPIVSVAAAIRMDGGRIRSASVVLGAVAPVPLRAKSVEEFLAGKEPTEETAEAAGSVATRAVFPLGRNAYKAQIVRALLRKAILGAGRA